MFETAPGDKTSDANASKDDELMLMKYINY